MQSNGVNLKQSNNQAMKKTLLIFALALTFSFSFAQQGCPFINAGPDVTLDSSGCTTLQATYLATGRTTSYKVASIPYTPPYLFNAGTPVTTSTANDWSTIVNWPFTFCFFGNSYTQINIGRNGVLAFQSAGNSHGHFSDTVPSPNLPTSAIFCPYHSLNAGTIYYGISGSYPCRQFYVSWNQVELDSCSGLFATQLAVLYENSNVIDVYIQNSPLCTNSNHGNAVIGIQNANGSIGYTPLNRNTSQWSASNEAWRFTPNDSVNYSVSWYEGATLISNNDSVTVCPTTTTTYTAQILYNECSGIQTSLSDNVIVSTASGINDESNTNSELTIFPNPTKDELSISAPRSSIIKIYNIEGQLIKTVIAICNKTSVNISSIPQGVYALEAITEKGIMVKRFVKE